MARLDYMEVARYLYKNTPRMSNLKLQKMMFFAYIEYYEKYQEELFKDDFEAWVYGPVLPELYNFFYQLLLDENSKYSIKDEKIKKILDNVIKEYGDKEAFTLVDLSHKHPIWIKARGSLPEFQPSNIKLNIKKFLNENSTE